MSTVEFCLLAIVALCGCLVVFANRIERLESRLEAVERATTGAGQEQVTTTEP